MPDPKRKAPAALGQTAPLVPPIYQSSVYTLPDLDALDAIFDQAAPGFIYARDAHPNAQRLARRLADVEAAQWGTITASGMAAITAIVVATVQQGQRIVASNRLYGRTVQLFSQQLERFGVACEYVDTGDLAQVAAALEKGARLLFVETMSNPLLRVPDLPALAELAHRRDCLFVVDNTFATPVLTRPMEMGADFVMESLTKMIGGHSDVTLGLVCGNDPDMLPQLSASASIWGLSANPFDCWLAERGMATLDLRMRTASANAARLADWLAEHPRVSRVVYPGRADHADHVVAGRILDGAFGNMLCFELTGGRDAVNNLLHRVRGVPFSPSLGHTGTTLSHPATTSHRYVSPAEKRRQGISDGLIRLSVGIEDAEEIENELAKGL